MTTMAAVFDPDATATAPVTIAQLEKNETVDAEVEIDAYPDDSGRIHQVLDDGTYVPAGDSKMERNAALSSMFVARTLAERHGIASRKTDDVPGNNDNDDDDQPAINGDANSPEWCQNSWKYGEGALYEAGRVLAILECLRTDSQASSAEAKLQPVWWMIASRNCANGSRMTTISPTRSISSASTPAVCAARTPRACR